MTDNELTMKTTKCWARRIKITFSQTDIFETNDGETFERRHGESAAIEVFCPAEIFEMPIDAYKQRVFDALTKLCARVFVNEERERN